MPRSGDFDTTYPAKLKQIGIELLEDFKGTKIHHNMKCMNCSHVWLATPLAKLQISFKKYGVNGCPACENKRRDNHKAIIRQANVQKLQARGFEIISNWDGRRVNDVKNIPTKVTVRNKTCGHTFTSEAKNLLARGVECPTCATQYRTNVLNARVERVHTKWAQTATDWQLYKSKVTKLTRKSYKIHKKEINPNDLPRGRAGTPGAYHVDHVVPIRYCFENNIPVELCSHSSNLQMLGWNDNVGSRDKLKDRVPTIFKQYIPEHV